MSTEHCRPVTRRRAAILGIPILLAVVTSPVGAQDGEPPSGPPATPVHALPVTRELIQEYRLVTGDLHARARSRVATIEAGLVVECPVDEGDVVTKGDVLARLDDRRLVLELERLKAQQAVAEALVDERIALLARAERDLKTIKDLEERSASNPKELADAESDVQAADARKQQAEQDVRVLGAQVDLVRTRLADMTIRAPFDSVIVSKETEVGQWVATGESLVEAVSVGAYDAWLDVPQQFADAVLVPDVEVAVELRASGRRFAAVSPRFVRDVDRTARTFSLVVPVVDVDGHLAPGMSVTGWIPTGQRGEHLLVPRDALLRNEAGFYVYAVVDRGGEPPAASPRSIEVIFEHDDMVAIRPGPLKAGDLVVTEGNERLFPMMPVTVLNPGASAGSAATPATDARRSGKERS